MMVGRLRVAALGTLESHSIGVDAWLGDGNGRAIRDNRVYARIHRIRETGQSCKW